jgi:Glyoxalase-like domain
MGLDHVFVLVEEPGPEIARMRAIGLVETYRRIHHGQGTQNVCYAFDNMFLELLWISDAREARSDSILRTQLFERSQWRGTMACRFGVAWRDRSGESTATIPTWAFTPPYLPAGLTIDVATASDDPRQPMMFRSPGKLAPAEWPEAERGNLQRDAGFSCVSRVVLGMPSAASISPALHSLSACGIISVQSNTDVDAYSLELEVEHVSGPPLTIRF